MATNENFHLLFGQMRMESFGCMKKNAYGLIDGSRQFYLEMKKTLESLGMIALSGDPIFYTFHHSGELIGFV